MARMLHLSPKQREAISQELRTHLEERLDELAAQGLDREQAIRTALDEFGDASSLAHDFTDIAHTRTRRRIMRTNIGTLATAAMIVLAFTYLLPEHRTGVPAPAQTQAQAVTENSKPVQISASNGDLRGLSQLISVRFTEHSFENMMNHLSDTLGMNFFVNWRVIEEDTGITRDTPVTLMLNDVEGAVVLSLVLQSVSDNLEFTQRDGVVIISSRSDLSQPMMRLYDCQALIEQPITIEQVTQIENTVSGGLFPISVVSRSRATRPTRGRNGGLGGGAMMMPGVVAVATPDPRQPDNLRAFDLNQVQMVYQQRAGELAAAVVTALGETDGAVSIYDKILIVHTTPKGHEQVGLILDMLENMMHDRTARRKAVEAKAGGG